MSILDSIYEHDKNSKYYQTYLATVCPWHTYQTPSLSLLIHEDYYKCLSCGAFGKTKNYLDQLRSHSIIPIKPDLAKMVRNPFNRWLRQDALFPVLKRAYRALQEFPQQGKYLKKRGLTEEMIGKLKCGYLDGFFLIPILDELQRPIGALARAGESITNARYFVPKGQSTDLIYSPNWDRVRDSSECYLTFGVFDAIAIELCGHAAISTTGGKRLDPVSLQDVRKKIKVFPDYGEEPEARKLASELGWRGSTVKYQYPYGIKDPANLFEVGLLQQVLQ